MAAATHAQDAQLVAGGWLFSGPTIYQVKSLLGQGSFGKVAKCVRIDNCKTVAIKMMKMSHYNYARAEVDALQKIKMLDSDKCNLVQWYQSFTDQGHVCLEFEHLDKSLYDFMKERYFRPLSLTTIRPIVQQIATALHHLRSVRLIHADLKLENIMLVNQRNQPFRVKLIDFGLACERSAATPGSYIQSRPYRSPEIILGLPYTEAIDMWSLGCVAATLHLGHLLYPGKNQYDMIKYIMETQGQLPDHLLDNGQNTSRFFYRDGSTSNLWRLKTPQRFFEETGILSQETRRRKLTCLDDLLQIREINPISYANKVGEMCDLLMFVDLVKGMLQLDAAKRMTPRQVLDHPFITMRHLDSMLPLSSYIKSCFDSMKICLKKPGQTDRVETVKRLLHTVISGTTPPVQQDPPSDPVQLKQNGKRQKADDDDEGNASNLPPAKKIKAQTFRHQDRQSCAETSASSRHPFVSLHHHAIKPGVKRRVADEEDADHRTTAPDHHHRKRFCSASTWK